MKLEPRRLMTLVFVTAAVIFSMSAADAQGIPGVVVETSTPANWRKSLGLLDGTWQGALEVVATTDKTPARFWHAGDKPELKLVIDGRSAAVSFKSDDWRELRIGDGFHALKIEASGFIYAVQTANGWVEHWNLSVTKKDPETLLVFLSYTAGATLERLESFDAEFAVGAMGELRRVPTPFEDAP